MFSSLACSSIFSIILGICQVQSHGNSITFSPNRPLCNGDVVEMICFVKSSVKLLSSTARVSINSSTFTIADFSMNTVKNGVHLSRYTANTDGLNPSLNRAGIRVIIRSYQPSDSDTTFGCHGLFYDYSISNALESKQPNAAAVLYLIYLEHSITNFDSVACTATVNLTWTHPNQPANSPLTVEQYFLYLNGTLIATVIPPLSSYSYNTSLQLNTPYIYSITATNCAGNTSDETILFIPASPNPLPPTPIMVLDTLKITPDMSATRISQALQCTIKLIKSNLNTNNQTVDTIQDYSEMFYDDFSLDTCYFTETTVKTCALESSPTTSRKFIVYNLENITIDQCLSYDWVSGLVTLDVTDFIISNISCSNEDYDTQFLADGLLSAIFIKRNDPTFSMNITNITLTSPFIYELNFVGKIVCEEVIFLQLYFNGIKMSNYEIPFCCPVHVPGLYIIISFTTNY